MVAALGYLWYAAGLQREGIQWCAEFLALEPALPDEIRAGVLHGYGYASRHLEASRQGRRGRRPSRSRSRRRLGNPARLAAALNNLGNSGAEHLGGLCGG
jgi:hypothetical protein